MSRSLPLTIDTSEAVKAIDTTIPQLRPTIRKQSIKSYITNIPLSTTTTTTTKTTSTIITTKPPLLTDKMRTMSTNTKKVKGVGAVAKMGTTNIQFPIESHGDEDVEDIDTNVVPYDEQQSVETINQHTNFIFNWHMKKNSDITAIEPLHQTEKDILNVLANIQKPLLFGMTAGITLLMLLVMFFACPMRKPRLSTDKAMLMAEDLNAHGLTLPPALTASRSIGVTAAAAAVPPPTPSNECGLECKSPAMCSRDTLRV